jgi:poly-gamma-glutamate capsule biosynthesis protein CapA/YwtB (metallophosphatase superfamily)
MDPFLMKEDIQRLRPQVDYVLVAIHWATSRSAEVSPENRAFAHSLIDAGADVILAITRLIRRASKSTLRP